MLMTVTDRRAADRATTQAATVRPAPATEWAAKIGADSRCPIDTQTSTQVPACTMSIWPACRWELVPAVLAYMARWPAAQVIGLKMFTASSEERRAAQATQTVISTVALASALISTTRSTPDTAVLAVDHRRTCTAVDLLRKY